MFWHFPTHCSQFCVYTPQPAVLHLSVDFIILLFIVTRQPPHVLGENIRLSALEHLVQFFVGHVGPSWRARRHVIRVLDSRFQKKFRYIQNKKKPHHFLSKQFYSTSQATVFSMSQVIITFIIFTLHCVYKNNNLWKLPSRTVTDSQNAQITDLDWLYWNSKIICKPEESHILYFVLDYCLYGCWLIFFQLIYQRNV